MGPITTSERRQRFSEFCSTTRQEQARTGGRLSKIMKNSSAIQEKETSLRGGGAGTESSKGGVPIKLLSKYLHRCTRRVASERLVVSFPEKRLASRPPGGSRQEIICEHPPHGWWGHTGGCCSVSKQADNTAAASRYQSHNGCRSSPVMSGRETQKASFSFSFLFSADYIPSNQIVHRQR